MEEIEWSIETGKKAWIQTKHKEELILIANQLIDDPAAQFSDNSRVDDIRKYLREYIDGHKFRDCSAEKQPNLNMSAISNLEAFGGGNWNAYRQQLECFFVLNDIEDDKKVPLLITKLSTNVYELLTTLCTPESPINERYENICDKLQNHYHPVRNCALEQAEFRRRNQKRDENIDQYILDLKKISKNCNFKNLNEEIKERLLNGTRFDAVRFEMLKQADLPLDKLIHIAKTVETAYNLAYKKDDEETRPQMFKVEKKIDRNRKFGIKPGMSQFKMPAGGVAGSCFCCGKVGHMRAQCTLREKYCSECGIKGHIYKMCNKNKDNWRMKTLNAADTDNNEKREVKREDDENDKNETVEPEMFDIFYFSEKQHIPSAKLNVSVNGKMLDFEIDTGADVSTITYSDKNQYFPNLDIKHRNVIFTNFDQSTSTPLGVLDNLSLMYGNVNLENQTLYIVKDGLPRIIGKNWLSVLKLWPPVFEQKICESTSKDELEYKIKNEFANVFEPGMGEYKGESIHLEIEENARPIFMPVRTVPFALKDKVKDEIERLIKNKRIVPVEYADWGTPVVPVLKPDGSVRLCGDFRITINKYLKIDHYPLPTIDQILMKLQGNQFFCELDLREAYLQAPLDEDSQKLVSIVTEEGIFKYLFLPFGVSTGPGSFQRLMSQKLSGLDVIVYIDNIYVYGKTMAETYDKLKCVLTRLQDSGLRIKIEKCKFFEEKLEVFGFEVNQTGVKVIKSKIKPLLSLPPPENVKMLRSFLGKVNYYNRFLQNMATILKPLYDCLKKDKFEWTPECDTSFNSIKHALANTSSLSYLDKNSQIVLTCDSSDSGVAAILSVKDSNNVVRPVAFASRKLNDTQMKYPILEKEAFAIVFGVTKFYEYLFGQKFTLQTDNEALAKILGPKYGIPKMAAKRLQYWAIFLSGFNFNIEHIKSKNNPADYLSRVAIDSKNDYTYDRNDEIIEKSFEANTINYITSSKLTTLNWETIQKETKQDNILCNIIRFCRDGWPASNSLGEEYDCYFVRKNEISLDKECVLWGYRVIIPRSLQDEIMLELHASHLGTTRMKEIARSYFWWPDMDKEIGDITKNCKTCLENHKLPEKIKLTPWPQAPCVWHRLHADFLGPLYGKMYLVIIDAYSKWPEVFVMSNITARKTIEIFKSVYIRFGYPFHLVTDNGATWTSEEFKNFCKLTGVKQSFTPTYYPPTNGLAERFVESFKSHVIKIVESGHSPEYACNLFLFDYRNSIHKMTGQSPAKTMFGRELRCRFSLLRPNPITALVDKENIKQSLKGSNVREVFLIGEKAMRTDSPVKDMKKKMAANAEKEKNAAESTPSKSDKPAEKPADKPIDKPSEKPSDKPADKPADKSKADKPADKQKEKAPEKPAEKNKTAEKKDGPSEKKKEENGKGESSGKTEKPGKAKQNGSSNGMNGSAHPSSDSDLLADDGDETELFPELAYDDSDVEWEPGQDCRSLTRRSQVKAARTPETPRPGAERADADDSKDSKVLKLSQEPAKDQKSDAKSDKKTEPKSEKKSDKKSEAKSDAKKSDAKQDGVQETPKADAKKEVKESPKKDDKKAEKSDKVEFEVVVEIENSADPAEESRKPDTNFSKSRVKVSPYRRSTRLADQTSSSIVANYTGNNTTMEMDITESSSFMEDSMDDSYLSGLRSIKGRRSYKPLKEMTLRNTTANRSVRSVTSTIVTEQSSRPTAPVVGRKRKPEPEDNISIASEAEELPVTGKRQRLLDRLARPFRRTTFVPLPARRNAEIVGINTDLPLTAPVASTSSFDPETLKTAPEDPLPAAVAATPVAEDSKRCVIM